MDRSLIDNDEQQRAETLRAEFKNIFNSPPDFIARAPGRINLIGEHTDYNGGFVLPAAIDRTVLIAVKALPGTRRLELYSIEFGNQTTFELDNLQHLPEENLNWANYIAGVAWALQEKGLLDLSKLPGAQMAITGNVPRGSGLSSSAALEIAASFAFMRLEGAQIDPKNLALASQYAENNFVGVKCGIMDQFISALGRTDSALLIDTRSLDYQTVPLGLEQLGYRVVAVESAVPRTLGNTAYNQRRAECEEAAAILARHYNLGPETQLRDISPEQFQLASHELSPILLKRARHVVSEDARTLEAVELMKAGFGKDGNLGRFGELLYDSHTSLRDDYEVSCKELDLLVDLTRQTPGVIGARMTGAGFGGCTVNIVAADNLGEFETNVVNEYRRQTGLPARWYVCKAVAGGGYI